MMDGIFRERQTRREFIKTGGAAMAGLAAGQLARSAPGERAARKEISMKKDKIEALGKYDNLASELNEADSETNAALTAILYVYYEIFFSGLDLY